MTPRSIVTFVGLGCAIAFGGTAVAGWMVAGRMQALADNGVEASAVVTRLDKQPGLRNSVKYRVVMTVDDAGREQTLVDEVPRGQWEQLSPGARVRVAYVPGEGVFCKVGGMRDVQATREGASRFTQIGLIGFPIGAALVVGSWWSGRESRPAAPLSRPATP